MMDNDESINGNSAPQKSKKAWGQAFDEYEEKQLVTIWASTSVQQMFKKYNRHSLVYQHIAKEHNKIGRYNRTPDEVQSKIKNCKTKYNKSKPKSGDAPPTWPSYYILHEVLGQKDSCTFHNLEDSLRTTEDSEVDNRLMQLPDTELLDHVDSQLRQNNIEPEDGTSQQPPDPIV